MELKERVKHSAICLLSAFLFLCLLVLFGAGCARVDGGTTHRVEGEAKVRVIVEFPLCEALEDPEAQQACIEALLEALEAKEEAVDQPENIMGSY